MKKILSLVLSLALVFGSFGSVFADDKAKSKMMTVPKDVVGTDYEEAVTSLTALEIVNGYEDGTFQPDKVVTRAEMAKLVITELGLEADSKYSTSNFKDLAGYKWAEGYIGYAQALGIINGYTVDKFGPGDPVTYNQALTMIVRALGYTKDCKEMVGRWPAPYVQKANILGITDDVKAGGEVGATRGNISQYLYNMLPCEMGYADADGRWNNKVNEKNKKVTVLMTLDCEEQAAAEITDARADQSVINIRPYVGQYGTVFTLTKGDNKGDVVAVGDIDTKKKFGVLNTTGDTLTAPDGTEYDIKNPAETVTKYVNGADASATSAVRDIGNVFVELTGEMSGNNFDKNELQAALLWNGANTTGDIVTDDDVAEIKDDHKLLGFEFVENSYDDIDLTSFELIGAKKLDDIKKDDVVYVYADGSKNIRRVVVGNATVEGKITKSVDSGKEITLDGKTFYFAANTLGNVNAKVDQADLQAGDTVKVTLDGYGYIYDGEATDKKADRFAVVVDSADKGSRLGDKAQLEVILPDGSSKIFLADEDEVDDTILNASGAWQVPFAAPAVGTVIKYGLDSDGVIDDIEVPTVVDATLAKDITVKKGNVYYNGAQFASNVTILDVDESSANATTWSTDDGDYEPIKLDALKDADDVWARYALDDDDRIEFIMAKKVSSTEEVYGVLTDIAVLDEGDEWELTMLVDGKEVTYKTEKDFSDNTTYPMVGTAANKIAESFYKITFDADGLVDDLEGFDTTETEDTTVFPLAANGITMEKLDGTDAVYDTGWSYGNRVFKILDATNIQNGGTAGDFYTMAKGFVIYVQDGDAYEKGTTTDLRSELPGKSLKFFDLTGNGVYDVVVIID